MMFGEVDPRVGPLCFISAPKGRAPARAWPWHLPASRRIRTKDSVCFGALRPPTTPPPRGMGGAARGVHWPIAHKATWTRFHLVPAISAAAPVACVRAQAAACAATRPARRACGSRCARTSRRIGARSVPPRSAPCRRRSQTEGRSCAPPRPRAAHPRST